MNHLHKFFGIKALTLGSQTKSIAHLTSITASYLVKTPTNQSELNQQKHSHYGSSTLMVTVSF